MSNLWLRYLIILLSIIGGAGFMLWGRRIGRIPEAWAVILWLLNVSLFHALRMLGFTFPTAFLNNWALGIQLQAVLTLAVMGVLLARGAR